MAFNLNDISYLDVYVNNYDSLYKNLLDKCSTYNEPDAFSIVPCPDGKSEMVQDIKFYQLFGVKYIITAQTNDLNQIESVNNNILVNDVTTPFELTQGVSIGQTLISSESNFDHVNVLIGSNANDNSKISLMVLKIENYQQKSCLKQRM